MLMSTSVLWGGTALAAEETPEYLLGELVVTATRTPVEEFKANANISVVTRDTIEKNHYSNVQDALRDIPGVTISGYGNTGEVYSSNSLILNGSDKVVVLIDGVRANINGSSSTYGKMATSELSNMDSIERIEVLKSSASTLYGADAAITDAEYDRMMVRLPLLCMALMQLAVLLTLLQEKLLKMVYLPNWQQQPAVMVRNATT